ncbi:SRPBCC family protein [Paenibacillus piri]|uniref:SRPBCC domain-containing protein n=1 Tax=Paenibacillus piri TaxID=2547395 RepID=A0A4V2ZU81_9BACL|nr:SRPBCC domain-containing protein [Paenibacillus piri]TDF99764.1 SRPBCC domain-containing protein [Paenibacillus piri]
MANQKDTKPVGLTASAGYQIGVRRTLPISTEHAWAYIVSPEGLERWLSSGRALAVQKGEIYTTKDGFTGELRVVKPYEQLRLTWQKQGWSQRSTLQIRLLAGGPVKTTVSFHQEKLDSADVRADMKAYWEAAIEQMSANGS